MADDEPDMVVDGRRIIGGVDATEEERDLVDEGPSFASGVHRTPHATVGFHVGGTHFKEVVRRRAPKPFPPAVLHIEIRKEAKTA